MLLRTVRDDSQALGHRAAAARSILKCRSDSALVARVTYLTARQRRWETSSSRWSRAARLSSRAETVSNSIGALFPASVLAFLSDRTVRFGLKTRPKQRNLPRIGTSLTCLSNFRVTGNEMRDLRLASPGGHSGQRLISPIGHLRVAPLNDHRVSSPSDSEIRVHSPSEFSCPLLPFVSVIYRPVGYSDFHGDLSMARARGRRTINFAHGELSRSGETEVFRRKNANFLLCGLAVRRDAINTPSVYRNTSWSRSRWRRERFNGLEKKKECRVTSVTIIIIMSLQTSRRAWNEREEHAILTNVN